MFLKEIEYSDYLKCVEQKQQGIKLDYTKCKQIHSRKDWVMQNASRVIEEYNGLAQIANKFIQELAYTKCKPNKM